MPAYLKPILYVLAGAVAATLVATTSALAGSGIGGVFNLGQTNTVNGTSVLTGLSAGPQLKVQNSISGNHGVLAQSAGGAGVALYGQHTSAAGVGPALRADSASTAAGAFSVYGLLSSTAPGANSAALRGENKGTNANGYGVWGSQVGAGKGVYGTATTGTGVLGVHTSTGGTGPGVQGDSASTAAGAVGVLGRLTSVTPATGSAGVKGTSSGTAIGVLGQSPWVGVRGESPAGAGVSGSSDAGWGVYGESSNNFGVYGNSDSGPGVRGFSSDDSGVDAFSSSGNGVSAWGGSNGVHGESSGGSGVLGQSLDGVGVYGYSSFGSAGYFEGNVTVQGTLSKGAGAFKIDHPLDPAHKYLQHSFVESPDMMNVYNGNVTTDGKGFATVKLPAYFQALNRDFRYQMTILGHAPWGTQARVWDEIGHNRFTIRTNRPKVRVSWQVTGVRQDRFANANRIRVVTPKTGEERSRYLHPQLYGQPRSKAIGAEFRRPPRQAVRPAR